jgi:hypothetical protein
MKVMGEKHKAVETMWGINHGGISLCNRGGKRQEISNEAYKYSDLNSL